MRHRLLITEWRRNIDIELSFCPDFRSGLISRNSTFRIGDAPSTSKRLKYPEFHITTSSSYTTARFIQSKHSLISFLKIYRPLIYVQGDNAGLTLTLYYVQFVFVCSCVRKLGRVEQTGGTSLNVEVNKVWSETTIVTLKLSWRGNH